MNIIIKENKNIIKSKQKLFDDEYLNILVNIIVEDNYNTLLTSIKYFFYITDETNYTKQYYLMKIRYSNQIEKCEKIYKLFKKWKPYEKYNMGECRGTFLELLSNKLLTKKYSENNVFRESKIIIDNYQSNTWDNICIHDKNINCYECKFSINSLKRGNIDNMLGIHKKSIRLNIYLVTLDLKEDFMNNIIQLKENTKEDTFNTMLEKINYITIENFLSGNPF